MQGEGSQEGQVEGQAGHADASGHGEALQASE